jgi:hypothetical protein
MPNTSALTLSELWQLSPRYVAMQRRRKERAQAYRAFLAELQPVCEQPTKCMPVIHVPAAQEQRNTEPLRLHKIRLYREGEHTR